MSSCKDQIFHRYTTILRYNVGTLSVIKKDHKRSVMAKSLVIRCKKNKQERTLKLFWLKLPKTACWHNVKLQCISVVMVLSRTKVENWGRRISYIGHIRNVTQLTLANMLGSTATIEDNAFIAFVLTATAVSLSTLKI